MSEQERRPRMACERYAPTLALLDDASTDADARDAALDHLAGCVWCQADQSADNQIDDALRRAFGPASVAGASPLRTGALLAAIGATSEPAAMPRWAAGTRGETIRSVVYLGDFDDIGGFDRMSEQDERAGANAINGQNAQERDDARATPARRMAAIPSLRPAPPQRLGRQFGRQAMTLSFSATAVAVALIVVAVTLFGSRGRAPTRTAHASASASATQTASAQRAAGAASLGPIVAISMISPNDGWALGDAMPQANGSQEAVAEFYHYDGSNWRLAQVVKGFSIYTDFGTVSIKMLSPTDGWTFSYASASVLHYDGTTWRSVTIAPNGARVLALDMEPGQGWAAVQGAWQTPLSFLRYDGQQWTRDASAISLPGLDTNQLVISGISAVSASDVWAVGYAYTPPPSQGTGIEARVGLIFHRVGGVWQLASRLNAPSPSVANLVLLGIQMLGPTSGWIVGDSSQTTTTTEVGGSSTTSEVSHALLLHYNGAHWTPVSVPLSTPSDNDRLSQIVATAPDSVWVMVTSNAQTILPNGVAFSGDALHYDGTAWSEVKPSVMPMPTGVTSVTLTALSSAGDGTLWAVGMTETVQNQHGSVGSFFCHYVGGVWQVVTPVTSGA